MSVTMTAEEKTWARRMQHGHITKQPLTDLERKAVLALASCRFFPGSWAKRFVRDMQAVVVEDKTISQRQRLWIWKLVFQYRKQLAGRVEWPKVPPWDDPALDMLLLTEACSATSIRFQVPENEQDDGHWPFGMPWMGK